jgi:glycosyltransferase involved in cell wall biosynthesis
MISIVIPVFNRKRFVEEMIKCIISQTYSNWELILVDDGSIDGAYEMMIYYSTIDNRIQVMKRERQPKGSQTCRNIGLECASGKYILFFDSDDLISNTCLENRRNFMRLNQEIDFGIFPAKSFTDPLSFDKISYNDMIWGIKTKKDDLSLFLSSNYPFIVWTNVYKRKSLIENNIKWDENVKIYQDFDFNITVLMHGLNYKYASDKRIYFDYFYRVLYSPDTISFQHFSKEKFNSTLYLLNKVLDFLQENKKSSYYKDKFFSFILSYYKNIIISRSFEYIPTYLAFCKKHYSSSRVFKLTISTKILKKIKNRKTFNIVFISLLCFFFPQREFIRRIKVRWNQITFFLKKESPVN